MSLNRNQINKEGNWPGKCQGQTQELLKDRDLVVELINCRMCLIGAIVDLEETDSLSTKINPRLAVLLVNNLIKNEK